MLGWIEALKGVSVDLGSCWRGAGDSNRRRAWTMDSPSKWKPPDCKFFFWLDLRAGSVGEVCGTFQAVANVYTGRENLMLQGGGRSTELRLLRVMDGRSGSLLTLIILCVRRFFHWSEVQRRRRC